MIPERLIPALATTGTLIGAAVVVLGQGVFDPSAAVFDRVIAAGGIVGVGYMVIRWTFRLLREVRAIAAEDRDASIARERLLLKQVSDLTHQLAEVNGQLTAERTLRLSLEQKGIADRRTP